MLAASLISSVFGLKVTPKKVIILFFNFLFKIFSILWVKEILRLLFDLTTDFTIDKSDRLYEVEYAQAPS